VPFLPLITFCSMHVIWNSQHFSGTWWWIVTKYDFKQYNSPAQALLQTVLPYFLLVLEDSSLTAAIPHTGNSVSFWWLINHKNTCTWEDTLPVKISRPVFTEFLISIHLSLKRALDLLSQASLSRQRWWLLSI